MLLGAARVATQETLATAYYITVKLRSRVVGEFLVGRGETVGSVDGWTVL